MDAARVIAETGCQQTSVYRWLRESRCPILGRAIKTLTDVAKLKRAISELPELDAGRYETRLGDWWTARAAEREFRIPEARIRSYKSAVKAPGLRRHLQHIRSVWFRAANGQHKAADVFLGDDLRIVADATSRSASNEFATPMKAATRLGESVHAVRGIVNGPSWELAGRRVESREDERGNREFSLEDIAAVFSVRRSPGFAEPGLFTLGETAQLIGHGYTAGKLHSLIRGVTPDDPLHGVFSVRKRRGVNRRGRQRGNMLAVTQSEIDVAVQRLIRPQPASAASDFARRPAAAKILNRTREEIRHATEGPRWELDGRAVRSRSDDRGRNEWNLDDLRIVFEQRTLKRAGESKAFAKSARGFVDTKSIAAIFGATNIKGIAISQLLKSGRERGEIAFSRPDSPLPDRGFQRPFVYDSDAAIGFLNEFATFIERQEYPNGSTWTRFVPELLAKFRLSNTRTPTTEADAKPPKPKSGRLTSRKGVGGRPPKWDRLLIIYDDLHPGGTLSQREELAIRKNAIAEHDRRYGARPGYRSPTLPNLRAALSSRKAQETSP